jgi:hypothetical protein
MPNAELSLTMLFDAGAAGERTAHEVYADAIERAGAFKDVCKSARLVLPQIQWRAAAEEVAHRLREMLDVPLPRLLMNGWTLRSEMKSYCDAAKYPPDASVTVKLAKHSVQWSQKPKVQVRVNGVPIGALNFALEANATLAAAVVTIRGGRVLALNAGNVVLDGSVSLEDHEIMGKRVVDVPIPGRLDFGDGLSLCGGRAP